MFVFKDCLFCLALQGKAGTVPKSEELAEALKIYDLFIYIGHGSGMDYFNPHYF